MENKLPAEITNQMETADYHDGDFDQGIYKEEIMDMIEESESESSENAEQSTE